MKQVHHYYLSSIEFLSLFILYINSSKNICIANRCRFDFNYCSFYNDGRLGGVIDALTQLPYPPIPPNLIVEVCWFIFSFLLVCVCECLKMISFHVQLLVQGKQDRQTETHQHSNSSTRQLIKLHIHLILFLSKR